MMTVPSAPADLGATAYDELADRYDRIPVENRINRLMRRASLARIVSTFPPGSRILEVGCGTGDEALALAARGVQVVAIDASREMIRVARAKADRRGMDGHVEFREGHARDLPSLRDSLGASFDGGYASFSLAYEPDLTPVALGLHSLLRPGARFLASLPSRLCLVEFLVALGSGHPAVAGRRLSPIHGHKVGPYLVPIRTYTPGAFSRAMSPHFSMERVEALPAVVPPPYMNRVFARFDGLADALERADEKLRTRFPFRFLGDHFLADLRHRDAANGSPLQGYRSAT